MGWVLFRQVKDSTTYSMCPCNIGVVYMFIISVAFESNHVSAATSNSITLYPKIVVKLLCFDFF